MQNSPTVVNEVRSLIKAVDLVLEVLDARAPLSTRNPVIKDLIHTSRNLVLLNKADLAEEEITSSWIECFQDEGFKATLFHNQLPSREIINFLTQVIPKPQKEKFKRPPRIMVLGVPNVGKSSVVNALLQRKSARTGDKAGITRGKQWIRIKPGLDLLDTPGLVQPFINEQTYTRISALGVLPDSQVEPVEVAEWLVNFLFYRQISERLEERYGEKLEGRSDPEEILVMIGKKRGCLLGGGEVDIHQAASILLKDFREGRLGPISIEKPGEDDNVDSDEDAEEERS